MSGPRVLVAHDEAAIRNSAMGVAREAGYQVVGVADGDSARVLLLESRPVPGALVVDVALPRVLGYELVADIARAGLGTKVILVASVYSKTAYKRRPRSLYGADDYVEQHHVVDQLADKLARLLPGGGRSGATPAPRDGEAAAIRAAGLERLVIRYRDRTEALERAGRLARLIAADVALYCGDQLQAWVAAGPGAPMPGELARDVDEGRRLFDLRIPREIAGERDFIIEALTELAAGEGDGREGQS